MATPYTRSLRALEADDARPSVLGWTIAGLLGLAWLAWFFTFPLDPVRAPAKTGAPASASARPPEGPLAATPLPPRTPAEALWQGLGRPASRPGSAASGSTR